MLHDLREHPGDGLGQIGLVAGVVQKIIGASAFVFKGVLAFFAAGEFFLGPAPGAPDARKSQRPRGIHNDDGVAFRVQTGLEEEGGVQDDGRGPGFARLGDGPIPPGRQEGVDERLEPPALLGVGEDHPGDRRTVEGAGAVKHPIAPPPDQFVADRRGRQKGADGGVGIDDHAAPFREQPGHRALAGADGAGQADHDGARRVCGVVSHAP